MDRDGGILETEIPGLVQMNAVSMEKLHTAPFPQVSHFKKWSLGSDCSSQSLPMHLEMAHLIQLHNESKVWQKKKKSSCSNAFAE